MLTIMSDSASVPLPPVPPAPGRGLYSNRTLNLRAVKAVGYDMDYTLVHYHVDIWERRAHEYIVAKLTEHGWPVEDIAFLPGFVTRGLAIDTATGNLVKADRFGYVKRATHGTRRIEFDEQRRLYSRTQVDLDEPRWIFLNTFFSLSEAGMYAQLVDRLDAGRLGQGLNYRDLWFHVHRALDEAHAEGRMKAEIGADPSKLIQPDPDVALALLDQKHAGKKLLLITNSEWPFTRQIMAACIDPWLPGGMTWQALFDLVIVGARKPEFFSGRAPLFRVVDERGLLEPCVAGPTGPGVYLGGHADLVEDYLGVAGAEILYVGDHLYTDVRVSKDIQRWRTGLIVRELEGELADRQARRMDQARLDQLMGEKALGEYEQAQWRLLLQRIEQGYGPPGTAGRETIESRLGRLRGRIEKLDDEAGPLAVALGSVSNDLWGPLMYAGNDRSLLASQVELYADVYTSRVSNFLAYTPFAYLRAPRGTLPHDV